MVIRPAVTYTPCATSSRGKTGDNITFTQFEEGDIIIKSINKAERSDEYDEKSIVSYSYVDVRRH